MIEITEEEISAEMEAIHKDYPAAVKTLPHSSIREGAIHRLYYRYLAEMQKQRDFQLYGIGVDTSAESE